MVCTPNTFQRLKHSFQNHHTFFAIDHMEEAILFCAVISEPYKGTLIQTG